MSNQTSSSELTVLKQVTPETAPPPNQIPQLPPLPENGLCEAPHAACSELKSLHSISDGQSLGYMLGHYLQEILGKQATAFTHGVAGAMKWEVLQTQESCSKCSRWAKKCECPLSHPKDLFLRPKIQPVNNLVW